MSDPKAIRAHETRVVIDRPIQEVWKAITDAKEMARWFAGEMTVEPGVGGFVLAEFCPGMEWKTMIEVWEPDRHLRLTENREGVMSASGLEEVREACRLVEDFYLQAEGGKTILRLVHSGFGASKAWDDEYEGTQGGWPICFFRLKQGLEGHRHETAHDVFLITECHGIAGGRAIELLEAAQPLEVVIRQNLSHCGVLPDLNGSIVSFSFHPSGDGGVAFVDLKLYGMTDAQVEAIKSQWQQKLAQLFPPRLIAEKAIEINAPASRVWTVLTNPQFNEKWAALFAAKGPIDSDWKLGSKVLWRNAEDQVYVTGTVIALEPNRLLRFTVRSTTKEMQPLSGRDEDDITQTYALAEQDGHTTLSIAHGDFSKLANGDKILPAVVTGWDKLLALIKELAETSAADSHGNARLAAEVTDPKH